MYNVLLLILLIPVLFLVYQAVQHKKIGLIFLAIFLGGLVAGFFLLLDLWGEMLWFKSLDISTRFWTELATKASLALAGAVFVFGHLYFMVGTGTGLIVPALILGLYLGSVWGLEEWQTILLFIHRAATEVRDPILQKTTGFYMFVLPLLDSLFSLLLQTAGIAFVVVVGSRTFLVRMQNGRPTLERRNGSAGEEQGLDPARLYANGGALILILAFGLFLQRYHLLFSSLGVVTGPGWSDVHVRLPGYTIGAGIYLLIGCRHFPAWARRKRLSVQPCSSCLASGCWSGPLSREYCSGSTLNQTRSP